ncbi:MAG: response regulator, partial [Verrucomicrobia bacterium]|nr:response regulator [Verrucomicrobiota bacterium]
MPIEKVLILEDDRIQLDNLRDILRDKKYIVSGATTIARADEYLASDNYDLILVDLNLPDGNGLDFVRRLQMKPNRPLSVVMTSTGSIDSAVDCIQAGAFHYLVKPLKPAQLHTIISKAEDLSRLLSVNRFLTSPDHGEERFA